MAEAFSEERLIEPALGIIREVFEAYTPDVPFGLELEPFLEFATRQFESRRRRIEVARRQTLTEVLGTSVEGR